MHLPQIVVFLGCAVLLEQSLPSLHAETELLINGSFSNGTTSWQLDHINGAEGTLSIDDVENGKKAAHVVVPKAAETAFHVQLFQGKLNIVAGEKYHLSFRACGNPAVEIGLNMMVAEAPWTNLWKEKVKLTPEWQTFSFEVTATQSSDNARVTFTGLGSRKGDYSFTDVSLKTSK